MEITDYIISKYDQITGEYGRILVGICGRAGAGKTTLTENIARELKKQKIESRIYSGDWRFSMDSSSRKKWLKEKWKVGVDEYLYSLNQFSWWNFLQIYQDLDSLLKGNGLDVRHMYNRKSGKKELHVKLSPLKQGIILFENCILGGVEYLEKLNCIVLVNTEDTVCFERILQKDSSRRTLPEIMVRNLMTTYSENIFLKLLMENFSNKTITCNGNGILDRYPAISEVSHIPVPILKEVYRERKKATVFCDLDGSLIKHVPVPSETGEEIEVIDGSIKKINEFRRKGYYIVLTTSRPQHKIFGVLEKLVSLGLEFDQIVCDLPIGPRHLINDSKNGEVRAIAHPLVRDEGIKNVYLP